jgi:hypothetical protein
MPEAMAAAHIADQAREPSPEFRLTNALAELEQTLAALAGARSQLAQVQERADGAQRARERAEQVAMEAQAALARRVENTDRALAEARAGADEARRAAAAARKETETLLAGLHEAHEGLARHYLAWRSLQAMPAPLAHPDGPLLRASGVSVTATSRGGVHRHADLFLRDVSVGARRWADTPVRLVDHGGQPGLLIFASPSLQPLLSAWQPNGREGDREFMLIVPGDDPAREMLARLGASDWRIVCDLAGLMRRGAVESDVDRGHWSDVAGRLCRQLACLPVRWRYDGVELASEASYLVVRFKAGTFGAVALEHLDVRIEAGGEVAFLNPGPGRELAVSCWPVDASEGPAAAWRLPLGQVVPVAGRRSTWAAMPAPDRALVLGVLSALPGALAGLPGGSTLVRAGAAAHRRARLREMQAAWRSGLRAIASRITGRRR